MPVTVLDIPANKFIDCFAQQLKKEGKITQPAKFIYVKSGASRQYAPENSDWYFVRTAAILRRLYCQGTNGLNDIQRMFGSCKDGSIIPRHFKVASGAIIRNITTQLAKNGMVEIVAGEGRKLTDKGKKTLDQFASQLK